MIAASLLLLAASIATFLFGVFGTGLSLIGASIGCALGSALCLGVGVMRDSRRRPAVATGTATVSASDVQTYLSPAMPEEPELTPVLDTEYASDEPVALDEARESFFGTPATESYAPATESYDDFEPAPARAPRKTTTRKPAARKPAAKKSTAKKPAARSTAKKAAPKKAAARKPAAKSAAAKKSAPRKSTRRTTS